MTEKQKSWLIKIEREIRDRFPDDHLEDDDNKGWDDLLEYVNKIYEKANKNEVVKRWILEIIGAYQDRNNILYHPKRRTARETLRDMWEEKKARKEANT